MQARRNGADEAIVNFSRREYAGARQRATCSAVPSTSSLSSLRPAAWRPGGPFFSHSTSSPNMPSVRAVGRPASQPASNDSAGLRGGSVRLTSSGAGLRSSSNTTPLRPMFPSSQRSKHRKWTEENGSLPLSASGLFSVSELFSGAAGIHSSPPTGLLARNPLQQPTASPATSSNASPKAQKKCGSGAAQAAKPDRPASPQLMRLSMAVDEGSRVHVRMWPT